MADTTTYPSSRVPHDCNRSRCNDCVEQGALAERERMKRIIEGMDGPREGRSLDFGDVITSSAFDEWVDDLLAAIDGGTTDA